MIYLGIDPGMTGGLAVLDAPVRWVNSKGEFYVDDNNGPPLVFDTPTLATKGKQAYDLEAMAKLVQPYQGAEAKAIVENVHSMPKQGVSSSFLFGKGFGIWLGIISAYNIPLILVSPQSWKKTLGVTSDKNTSLEKARELFPTLAEQLKRKKDDGRAEALLIACYGRMMKA